MIFPLVTASGQPFSLPSKNSNTISVIFILYRTFILWSVMNISASSNTCCGCLFVCSGVVSRSVAAGCLVAVKAFNIQSLSSSSLLLCLLNMEQLLSERAKDNWWTSGARLQRVREGGWMRGSKETQRQNKSVRVCSFYLWCLCGGGRGWDKRWDHAWECVTLHKARQWDMTAEAEKNSQIHKSSKSSSEKKYSMNNFHKSSSLKCSSPVVGWPTTGGGNTRPFHQFNSKNASSWETLAMTDSFRKHLHI